MTAEKEVKQATRILYWENGEAIANLKRTKHEGPKAAAEALNKLFTTFPFRQITEVPSGDMNAWKLKRILEIDKDLADRAKIHRIETLVINYPEWLTKQAEAISEWNYGKAKHLPNMVYLHRNEEGFYSVNERLIEHEISEEIEAPQYRKYLTDPDEIERLNFAVAYVKGVKKHVGYSESYKNWNNPMVVWGLNVNDPNFLFKEVALRWVIKDGREY